MLNLAHGLSFADLYGRDGLAKLDVAFLDFLGASGAELNARQIGRASCRERVLCVV